MRLDSTGWLEDTLLDTASVLWLNATHTCKISTNAQTNMTVLFADLTIMSLHQLCQ